jgi:hypothetical protein
MVDYLELNRVLERIACFRQTKQDPLVFNCLAHFGLNSKARLQMQWMKDRGIEYDDVGADGVLYIVKMPDAETAMLFKLSFI